MRYHGDGYIRIKVKEHPYADIDGYVFQHRLVMEQHIGRYLKPEEKVHHINHIVTDNRIDNLQIVTQSEHFSLHLTKDMSNRRCLECGSNETYNRHWRDGLCHKCYCRNYYHRKNMLIS